MNKKVLSALMLTIGFAFTPAQANSLQKWPTQDEDAIAAIKALAEGQRIDSKIATQNAKQAEANVVSENLSRAVNNVLTKNREVIEQTTPDLTKCIALTKAMGGNGSSKAASIQQALNEESRNTANAVASSRTNSTQNRASAKVCTKQDILNDIGGCGKAKVDPVLAGATENVQVLTTNLKDGKSTTISQEQLAAAKRYIQQTGDYLPNTTSSGKNNTAYNKIVNQLKQDQSVVESNLNYILTQHAPLPMSPNSAAGTLWFNDAHAQEYKTWFGSELPKEPSRYDRLRDSVYNEVFGSASQSYLTQNELAQLRTLNTRLGQQNILIAELLERQDKLLVTNTQILNVLSRISSTLDDPSKSATAGR